jgi:hypothetical protein
MKLTAKALITAMMLSSFFVAVPQSAQASQVDMLIEKLVEKKILTRLDAEAIRNEIETAEKKDYKLQVANSTPWLDNLTSKGDVRLRYEAFDREQEDNRTATGDAGGTDRNRERFRVRWGLEKKFSDEWKAGFRIASGSGTNDATSTNQSFDGEFGLKDVFFDRAYGIWMPTERVKAVIPATNVVEVGAGKVENPYDRDKWSTSIIWDSDVTPEGIYEKWDFRLMDDKANEAYWDINTLHGQWMVDEDSDNSPGDQEMQSYGYGTTYQWKKAHKTSFKFTYYDWNEYADYLKRNPGTLANNFGGNDRTVDHFRIANFYADLDFEMPTWWGVQPVKLFGDYATNTGAENDSASWEDITSINNPRNNEEDAYSFGVTLGRSKDAGDWQLGYEYLYIEPNAVVGNFAESDLGLGFANNKGHKLSAKYMILKALELNFTAWMTERINTTLYTYGASDTRVAGDDDHVLRTQLDLVWKF